MLRNVNRRDFLAASASASCWAATAAWGNRASAQVSDDRIAFYFVSDTHFFAQAEAPDQMEPRSAALCSALVDTLNSLPGSSIPEGAGGGTVGAVRGVLHGGDVIDSGDKRGTNFEAMQRTEWAAFEQEFGFSGTEGRLKFPVFEVHGNHDSPAGDGLATDAMIARNRRRDGVSVSNSGLQYAWTWGDVRFINLGIVVGDDPSVSQRRRYAPKESLEFLLDELSSTDNMGRRFVLSHHVDVLRYSKPCDANDEANLGMEWNPCDARSYYDAIHQAPVLAVFFGHTHVRAINFWDGTPQAAQAGVPLFNTDNASHFGSDSQAFFYCEIDSQGLKVRECGTKDRWATHEWTPQLWERSIG